MYSLVFSKIGLSMSSLEDSSIVVIPAEACDEMESYVMPDTVEAPQQQLQEMLRENNELRDIVHKNNLNIRQIVAAFQDYQKSMLHSRELHKQKINIIQNENLELECEKDTLKKVLLEVQDGIQQKQSELDKAQEKLLSTQQSCGTLEQQVKSLNENLKRSELEVLTLSSQMKEMESEIPVLRLDKEKLANQNEALLEQIERQNAAFKERLESAEHRFVTNNKDLEVLKEENKEQQLQVLGMNEAVTKLTNMNEALQKQLEDQTQLSSHSDCKSQLDDAVKQADLLKKTVIDLEKQRNKLMEHLQGINNLRGPPNFEDDDMGFSLVHGPVLQDQSILDQFEEKEIHIVSLEDTVRNQKDQIAQLEKQLQKYQKSDSVQKAEIAEHFFQTQNPSQLTNVTTIFQDYEDRYESIGLHLGACEKRLQCLKREDSSAALQEGLLQEMSALQQILEQERLDKANQKKILEERIEQLTQNYRQILCAWDIFENDQTAKSRQNEALNAFEKRQHQEQLDELVAKHVNLEQESQAKDSELVQLKRQVSLLNQETEQMPILRAQVEVYRQDFTKEREDKGTAEATNERLREEVSSLQAQLSELRDELTVIHNNQLHQLSSSQEHHRQASSQQDESLPPVPIEEFRMPYSPHVHTEPYRSPNIDTDSSGRRNGRHQQRKSRHQNDTNRGATGGQMTYECPKCKMTYTSVTAIENHLDGCLREDGPYP